VHHKEEQRHLADELFRVNDSLSHGQGQVVAENGVRANG
jgi:hypothetical protein